MKNLLTLLFIITSHLALSQGPIMTNTIIPIRISRSVIFKKPEPIRHHKPMMLAYKPRRLPVKLTIKAGYNRGIYGTGGAPDYNQDAIQDLLNLDFDSAFDDADYMAMGRIDMRLKFYVKKRTRITIRAIIQKPMFCTIGVQFKV